MWAWYMVLLLASATNTVCGDPDLRQLLHVWRPTNSTWRHVTPQCAQAMEVYTRALGDRQQWASQMLDATGQSGGQFLEGNDYLLGSRSQCEKVNTNFQTSNMRNITIQEFPVAVYRILKLQINLSEPIMSPTTADRFTWTVPRYIWMGVCLPGACGEDAQVSAVLQQMLDTAENENHFRQVQLVNIKQLPSNYTVWGETSTTLLILLSATIVALTVTGTIMDIFSIQEENKTSVSWRTILRAFSLPQNARSLFCLTPNYRRNTGLPALHALRTISMVWVILCHSCLYLVAFTSNPSFSRDANDTLMFQMIRNGSLSVDTFFFISGLLVSYVLLHKLHSTNKRDSFLQACYKFLWIVIYRFLRLLLPYVFAILLTTVTYRQYRANSLFESIAADADTCPNNWWQNLLYINNLLPGSDMCMAASWYLGADTQLYILAVALLLLYVNGYRRTAISLGCVLLISSWLTTMTISYLIKNIKSYYITTTSIDFIYTKPWTHLGAVWIGIYTGWSIKNQTKFRVNKIGMTLGWICSLGCMILNVGIMHWHEYFDLTSTAIYSSLSSTVWACCLAWIVLTCYHKRAGWIGNILDSPMFNPLGKATYCVYLIHNPLLEWVFLSLEGPIVISRGLTMALVFGFIITSYGLGAMISLLFESPIIKILAILSPTNKPQYLYEQPETVKQEINLTARL